jgi:hypothetical protein
MAIPVFFEYAPYLFSEAPKLSKLEDAECAPAKL